MLTFAEAELFRAPHPGRRRQAVVTLKARSWTGTLESVGQGLGERDGSGQL